MKPIARFLMGLLILTPAARAGQYKNFHVAIYITVNTTRSFADPARLQKEWDIVSSQLKVDKVYLETYRDERSADEATIEPIKKFFIDHGVQVSGGITLAANNTGQFTSFCYADPADRQKVKAAAEMAARHFDEVILDDFFFYNTKTDADIAAKGDRTWTQYRLETMRDVAENWVVKPAKAVNPRVRMVVKFPNWYEHFQGLGYDLDREPKIFDGIYTGTETRDPIMTDQLLQQYESYSVWRYFHNIDPAGNGGGWVDTFSTNYLDRYGEQLWDTLFAKAPEITLFNWTPMASQPALAGDRTAWQDRPTSFDYEAMVGSYHAASDGPEQPTYARAAGYSLEQVDGFLGKLGEPVGIKSYKPFQSSGEDYLHNYMGNLGIPIELCPTFPTEAKIVLLTECAKYDPDIVAKIKGQLTAGKNVIITSGLLRALQDKGFKDLAEWLCTDQIAAVRDFYSAYGAGNGTPLPPQSGNPEILIPEIHFYTNDSWALVRAVGRGSPYPILLMNRYSKGILYLLTVPESLGDLYNLPQGAISAMKRTLLGDFPVWVDSPPQVSLFAYDNHSYIVESYLPTASEVTVYAAEGMTKLTNLVSGEVTAGRMTHEFGRGGRGGGGGGRGGARQPRHEMFTLKIEPHSYQVFSIQP